MFKKSMKYETFTNYLFLSHCLLESKSEMQRVHLSEAIAKNLVDTFFTVQDDIVRDHLIANLKNNLNKKIDDFQSYAELILSKYAESQELTGVIVFERLMSCLLELEKSLSQFGKNIKNDLKFFENTLNEEDKIRSFIIYEPDTMVSEKVETPPIPELIVLREEKTYDSEDEEEDKVL